MTLAHENVAITRPEPDPVPRATPIETADASPLPAR